MASEWIGVVYDTVSLTVRSVINPDADHELDDPAFTLNHHPQLKLLRVPRGEYAAMTHADVGSIVERTEAKLQGKPIGQTRTSRCAAIDTHGIVQHLLMAQPGIDDVPGHILLLSETARLGDRHDGTTFWTRVAHCDNDTGVCKEIVEVDLTKHVPPEDCHAFPSLTMKPGDKSPYDWS